MTTLLREERLDLLLTVPRRDKPARADLRDLEAHALLALDDRALDPLDALSLGELPRPRPRCPEPAEPDRWL